MLIDRAHDPASTVTRASKPGSRRQSKAADVFAAAAAVISLAAGCPAAALAVGLPSMTAPPARSAPDRLRWWNGYVRPTDGVRLWVHSVGGGARGAQIVVLVHGGPGLSLTYLHIFDQLATSARQIVSCDQRGSGRSTQPTANKWGIAAQVSDLNAVRRWAGVRRITVVGHSWGGFVAAAYTARQPQHVAALALLDALPLNWAAFVAGENRIGKRISALQAAGLIPNPLPPTRHNSCLARAEALTPAYLANPARARQPGRSVGR